MKANQEVATIRFQLLCGTGVAMLDGKLNQVFSEGE
jgi:hypothetical protein